MKRTFLRLAAKLLVMIPLACALGTGVSCKHGHGGGGGGGPVYAPSSGGGGSSGSSGTGGNSSGSGSSGASSVIPIQGMVRLSAGTFMMGLDDGVGYSWESPAHSVTLTRAFYICNHEVTQAEYKAVMGMNPSHFTGDTSRPVEQVSWYDAIEFCNQLSRMEGLTPCYSGSGDSMTCNFNANGYRLPTAAEWEYAARAGDTTTSARTWSGTSSESSLVNYAWYMSNEGSTTHSVKTKLPNANGLYDMSGNVFEWCWDWYGSYGSSAVTDPTGPSSESRRVVRGGDYWSSVSYCAVSLRNNNYPNRCVDSIGFRVVRTAQ